MSESAEPSTKRRHSDMDDIPPSMQFFKWAQLGRRSEEAINEIRQLVWKCKSHEAKDILYMFMKYYDSQMQKEKEYKEKMKQGKETGENKLANRTAFSSEHQKESKVENTHVEESDVQFLMERRSEILREMNEDTGGVESSEMEASEHVIEEGVIDDETEKPEELDRPPILIIPPNVQQIPQSPVTQPAAKTVIVKQEPSEVKVDQTASTAHNAAPILSATTVAPATRGILKKPKPEPIETSRKTSSSTEEPISPTLSTVAVANEPLTTAIPKTAQPIGRPPVALRPKLPSAPANLMPSARALVAPKVQNHPQHAYIPNDAAVAISKPVPIAVSPETLQCQKKQQVGGIVDRQPQSASLMSPTEKDEQQHTAPVQASPIKAVSYQQYKQQKQKEQQTPLPQLQQEESPIIKPQHQIPQSAQKKYKNTTTLEPEREHVLLAAKKETMPSPPLVPQDPVIVAILSHNLVALNKQAEYVNEVKEDAHAQNVDPDSEYLSIAVEQFADPGNTFTLKYFRTLKIYLSRAVDKLDLKLHRSNQLSVLPLQIRLRVAKMEIESIWERVRAAIDVHRVNKKAAYAQRVAVARMERGSSSHQGQHLAVKRSHADSSSASQWVHPPKSKRTRTPLLQTPPAPSSPSDDELCDSACDAAIVCAFCNEPHDSINCTKFTTYDEREKIRELFHLCWSCLAPFRMNHLSRCEMRGKLCSHCGNNASHAALCRKLLRTQKEGRKLQSQTALPRAKESPDRRNIEEEEEVDSDHEAVFSPQATPMYEEEVGTEEDDEKPASS